MRYKPSRAEIARGVMLMALRVVSYLLRLLLRPPLIHLLLVLLALYLLASLIGTFTAPREVYPKMPTVLDSR